ncbi:hypothetical protein M440DRAFT_1274189 [Trichoderma longibrachiatum ATCC 18648]|uniref:Uncharacterized protein n=1 Tax=Trichoderma longibrachiatum ATCC 18648 TaxID=983965 RepID=A0A2T4C1G1_TRILO|nr:hypothetical protein M440DRAFT_1274189 [Trichoderma longibrachiatum ATCC 18648]
MIQAHIVILVFKGLLLWYLSTVYLYCCATPTLASPFEANHQIIFPHPLVSSMTSAKVFARLPLTMSAPLAEKSFFRSFHQWGRQNARSTP